MNRTIFRFTYTVSWLIGALVISLSPCGFGQTFPLLMPVNVPHFTIPFEIDSTESANTIREVELLMSKDRGKHWISVARQAIETKKFAFHADSDGEYWFAFRTMATNGNVSPMNGVPQLRVLVNTKDPMVVLPSQPSESGLITPPKPVRFRDDHASRLHQPAKTSEPEAKPDTILNETNAEELAASMQGTIQGPRLPGLELPKSGENRDSDLLDDLLSGMSNFLDVQPVTVMVIPGHQVAADKSNAVPKTPAHVPAGGITGIVLNPAAEKSQIVVRWNTGHEPWHDAQIDILRSSTKEGQWSPIAINLQNNGEYWWFLTPEDLKPFYIAVRIRSLYGGIYLDVTQSPITIDPKLPLLQNQRP